VSYGPYVTVWYPLLSSSNRILKIPIRYISKHHYHSAIAIVTQSENYNIAYYVSQPLTFANFTPHYRQIIILKKCKKKQDVVKHGRKISRKISQTSRNLSSAGHCSGAPCDFSPEHTAYTESYDSIYIQIQILCYKNCPFAITSNFSIP